MTRTTLAMSRLLLLASVTLAPPAIVAAQDAPAPAAPAAPAARAPAVAAAGVAEVARSGADDVVVDEATERLINAGLRYLAARQKPNGSWADGDVNHGAAITAYAVIAFMSAGHLPGEGEHGQVVQRGVDFLLNCVRPNGYIAASQGEHNMYGHGIAALALGEAYGLTHDEEVRPRLERAIKLILASQNKEGGWRYNPEPRDADVSVSVLQAVALRVAKNSGIDVPQENVDRAIAYLRACRHASGGFTYQARGGGPGAARTAAAVYAMQVLGLYDDEAVTRGAAYYLANYERDRGHFSYGINYATPMYYMKGGEPWRSWYDAMRTRLTREARVQGGLAFWQAHGPGGDSYGTAVAVSILATPYGYLPLYQR
jgi:hypothetical protein